MTEIVMAPGTVRQYKHVFADAQDHLRRTFGMEMTELPQREKITVSQKRGMALAISSGPYIALIPLQQSPCVMDRNPTAPLPKSTL